MLYLELWQTTWSIIWSIQLKELRNNILHTQFKNFAKMRALCFQSSKKHSKFFAMFTFENYQ